MMWWVEMYVCLEKRRKKLKDPSIFVEVKLVASNFVLSLKKG